MMYIIQHKGKSKSDKLWFDGLDLARPFSELKKFLPFNEIFKTFQGFV